MSQYALNNGLLEIGFNPTGGMLDPVRFSLGNRVIEPMHRAPWLDEPLPDAPPMLQNLAGDFFCAPFSESDVFPEEARPHGLTANGTWQVTEASPQRLEAELNGTVAGARVSKRLELRDGHPLLYQTHRLKGGDARLPLGHHAMLRADEPLNLNFSPFVWGGTPDAPVETEASGGRSSLHYPQTFKELTRVETQGGHHADLSVYPVLERSEDILMLVSQDAPLAWSSACAPQAGWLWFALKSPAVLQSTVLWLSNGGRDYPPFSGRHLGVIGIEEVTSYFHLGHKASLTPNRVNAQGYKTSVTLTPESSLTVRYAFGLVEVPQGFERLESLAAQGSELVLTGQNGMVTVPFDASFFGL